MTHPEFCFRIAPPSGNIRSNAAPTTEPAPFFSTPPLSSACTPPSPRGETTLFATPGTDERQARMSTAGFSGRLFLSCLTLDRGFRSSALFADGLRASLFFLRFFFSFPSWPPVLTPVPRYGKLCSTVCRGSSRHQMVQLHSPGAGPPFIPRDIFFPICDRPPSPLYEE